MQLLTVFGSTFGQELCCLFELSKIAERLPQTPFAILIETFCGGLLVLELLLLLLIGGYLVECVINKDIVCVRFSIVRQDFGCQEVI